MTHKPRVLIASPIHQKLEILSLFLESLKQLKKEELLVHFYFIDDNENVDSSRLLIQFQECIGSVVIEKSSYQDVYLKDKQTHHWNEHLVWKVANFKNLIIKYAKEKNYDYLFFVDSDLLLSPKTLVHLVQQRKDIISEIFWTKWQLESIEQPQVWLYDEYTQYNTHPGEQLSSEQINIRYQNFITKMRNPGVYEVGGLGACTLISQNALQKGVNFSKIPNLTFWGEDRHFCIRAAAIGLSLHVDTHYPAYHIYRDTDIKGGKAFLKKNTPRQKASTLNINVSTPTKPTLTLSMIIKDEGNRFLREVLKSHLPYIDNAVIIDDGSTDNSVEICREVLKTVPCKIVQNKVSKFSTEVELRQQQWEETSKTDPNWILNVDADELFEDKFKQEVEQLLEQEDYDLYSFRLYDFWSNTHYREDEYWYAHLFYRPFLARYRKDFSYVWKETPQHCGRFPKNIFQLPNSISNLRVKHYGWSKLEYRLEKYKRYLTIDPQTRYGIKEQYDSILDKSPNLIKWEE
ncbi:glycosyltransferase family 2 protein [Priestia megaterium]|uniref:glycosyltransferase family 2 protein n=1 Tax=Priestia megaterium TaxID=1404 RepID=UPI00272F4418|nr:glycosyltransferase family 2 protein [Priestia megaterium]MDP1442170.1 glycosyltransferase family 2 protein [Priestia megaterium]MDP1471240.1 glycosyltransferase family 2 protein [Priestia megaterium]